MRASTQCNDVIILHKLLVQYFEYIHIRGERVDTSSKVSCTPPCAPSGPFHGMQQLRRSRHLLSNRSPEFIQTAKGVRCPSQCARNLVGSRCLLPSIIHTTVPQHSPKHSCTHLSTSTNIGGGHAPQHVRAQAGTPGHRRRHDHLPAAPVARLRARGQPRQGARGGGVWRGGGAGACSPMRASYSSSEHGSDFLRCALNVVGFARLLCFS